MAADQAQAQCIPGFDLVATGQADATDTIVDGCTAIIAVRMGELMGEHQLFSQHEPIKSSFVVHSAISREIATGYRPIYLIVLEVGMSVS